MASRCPNYGKKGGLLSILFCWLLSTCARGEHEACPLCAAVALARCCSLHRGNWPAGRAQVLAGSVRGLRSSVSLVGQTDAASSNRPGAYSAGLRDRVIAHPEGLTANWRPQQSPVLPEEFVSTCEACEKSVLAVGDHGLCFISPPACDAGDVCGARLSLCVSGLCFFLLFAT